MGVIVLTSSIYCYCYCYDYQFSFHHSFLQRSY